MDIQLDGQRLESDMDRDQRVIWIETRELYGQIVRWIDSQMDIQLDGQTVRWIDSQMDRQLDGQIVKWIDRKMDR